MRARFSLGCTKAEAENILNLYASQEVQERGGEYQCTTEWREIISKVADWLTGNGKPCLILMGNIGDGKSTILRAIKRIVNAAHIQIQARGGKTGEYIMSMITAKEYCDEYSTDTGIERYLIGEPTDILGLDDLGTEAAELLIYGNPVHPVTDLLMKCYAQQTQVVITTNLQASEVRPRYGSRLADRINEDYMRIIFPEESFRTAHFGVEK